MGLPVIRRSRNPPHSARTSQIDLAYP